MTWRIDYSKDAHKFIQKNELKDDVSGELKKFLLRLKGIDVNIDLKKLVGDWDGYYNKKRECADYLCSKQPGESPVC